MGATSLTSSSSAADPTAPTAPQQRLFFAGTATGVVRSFKFPITGEIKDYTCHCAPVTRLRLSEDDAYLFSVADDGCLAVFEVKDAAGGRLGKRYVGLGWVGLAGRRHSATAPQRHSAAQAKQRVEEGWMTRQWVVAT